jgi:uncharacterized iron-regulated membrane protein
MDLAGVIVASTTGRGDYALLMLLTLTCLLGLFIFVVALIAAARWRRRRERASAGASEGEAVPDAWAEAGRRAGPFPSGKDEQAG